MKTLRNIFTNPWALFGMAAYAASLALLWRNKTFSREDAISELVLFGFAFPLLAWLGTLRARPLTIFVRRSAGEMILLGLCLVFVAAYLIWGAAFSDALVPASWIASPREKFVITFTRKLIVFVLVPFALFRFLFGYRWRDFGLQWEGLRALRGNHLAVVVILSGAILLFQYFLGLGAAPIRRGELSASQVALGIPLAFVWLFIETGLVEEFFFRGLVQTRCAAWFKSEVSGVALMALLFGLAHAPGFILRHAGLEEAIGPDPSAADAIAYAIVILSVGGIFFGIVWARTKNLWAVMFIHAATDLLPNLKGFVVTWGL
ncbi:MAG TPA: CPBP family intramembrane glutamic endopeptidase [Chthoniobacterales bacterium]|nr:CPBP family intramembrane glutamic endopeptidase [Chthoniobacterales bacterium]